MKKILTIAWKDFIILFRDPGELILLLITPFALTLAMNAAFGGSGGNPTLTDIPVAIVNHDDGQFGKTLVQLFQSDDLATLVEPTLLEDDTAARTLVDDDQAAAAVIIPAAGRSSRFGGKEKKPYVSLDGRPIWQRSAELFWSRDDVVKVYLVLAPGDREDFRGRFGHLIAFANIQLVDGGAERFDSVANALDAIGDSVDLVAVHVPRLNDVRIAVVLLDSHIERKPAVDDLPPVNQLGLRNDDNLVAVGVGRVYDRQLRLPHAVGIGGG